MWRNKKSLKNDRRRFFFNIVHRTPTLTSIPATVSVEKRKKRWKKNDKFHVTTIALIILHRGKISKEFLNFVVSKLLDDIAGRFTALVHIAACPVVDVCATFRGSTIGVGGWILRAAHRYRAGWGTEATCPVLLHVRQHAVLRF